MRLAIHLNELRRVDVGIALRCADAGVAQQLLNHTQIGAALQQVGRKGMAQRMRTDVGERAEHRNVPAQQPIDAPPGEPPPARVDKQGIVIGSTR